MRQSIRDFLVCASVANFVMLGAWRLVLDQPSYVSATQPNHFLAIVITSTALAALFWCGVWLARRSGFIAQFLAKWLFLEIVLIATATLFMAWIPAARRPLVPMVAILLPIPLMIVRRSPRWVASLFLALVPCILFIALRAAWEMSHTPEPHVIRGDLQRLSADGPRVLLIVFDEMSEQVAFTSRPQGIKMPAFDRLIREGFVATAAYPPASHTIQSMPALLTGRAVRDVRPISGRAIRVQYPDLRFEPFTASSTVFSDVRALGLGTAMIGWYHPYCSIVRELDFCAHVKSGMATPGIYERGGLTAKILDVVSHTVPFVNATEWAKLRKDQAFRDSHDAEDSLLRATTRDALAQFRSGFMLVHLAIPHPPAIQVHGMYFPNLVAADQELAEIRSIMEDAGTWDSTAVLVTSDHWWRTQSWLRWTSLSLWTPPEAAYADADNDPRVPFIAKLPGRHASATYTPEFNILLCRKLVHALLKKEIATPDALKSWLDLHRNDLPAHAYKQAIRPF